MLCHISLPSAILSTDMWAPDAKSLILCWHILNELFDYKPKKDTLPLPPIELTAISSSCNSAQ